MFSGPGAFPVARRAHTKSRRGCKECKKRKVKCDERRPLCENCQRRWGDIEECEWEDAVSSKVTESSKKSSASAPKLELPIKIKAKPIGPKLDLTIVKSSAADLQTLRGAFSPASPLTRTINGHRLDPFGTHPQGNVNDVDILMKHYFSAVVFQSFPWQPKSEKNPVTKYYAPMIWADPVMFHATLQLSAVRLESRMSGFHIESRRLMAETIRLLNNRVRDPLLNISDQTIGAVAILATVEYERGNMKAFKMHLSGLQQMLSLRGGLATIRSSSPMLANMLFWTLIIAMTETTTLALDPNDKLDAPPWLHAAHATYAATPHLDLAAYGVAAPIASLMRDVKHLSQRFVRAADYCSAEECLSALTVVCNTLQRALSIPALPLPTPCPRALASEACRVAVALHVMTPWRGLRPDPTPVIRDLALRLRACVAAMLGARPATELLLWLLFTGGVSALGTPERAWFAKHLVVAVGDLGLRAWEEVRGVLQKVIWHEILCERSYRALWEEVRAWKEDLERLEL